jgi:hypothetical protein
MTLESYACGHAALLYGVLHLVLHARIGWQIVNAKGGEVMCAGA